MDKNLIAAFKCARIVAHLSVKADIVVFDSPGDPNSDLLVPYQIAIGVVSLADELAVERIGKGHLGELVVKPSKLIVFGGVEAHDGPLIVGVLWVEPMGGKEFYREKMVRK